MKCWVRVDITGPWFTHSATGMANTNVSAVGTILWLAVNTSAKAFPQNSKSWRFINYPISKRDIAKRCGEKVERLHTKNWQAKPYESHENVQVLRV